MLWLLVAAPLLIMALLWTRLFAFYPDPGRPLKRLRPWSYTFIAVAGDTLFPAGGAIEASARDVDVAGYVDRWFDVLPHRQRRMLTLLMLALEQLPLVFGFSLRRASTMRPARREAYFRRLDEHSGYYIRALLYSLRTVLSFAYLDHPRVRAAIGNQPRPSCAPKKTTHLSPENRGEGALLDLADHPDDVELQADVVVVGTGAGGAVAARILAEAGLDVIMLEEGGFHRPEEVDHDTGFGMAQIAAEGGLRTMLGPHATPTIQGRCVGGSTFPNSGILFRIPDHVLDEWAREHGVEGLTNQVLADSYARVEAATHRQQARPEQLGPKNLLFGEGAKALGIPAEPFHLGKVGCRGCGDCMPSCSIGAKQSADISYVPHAVRAGARLYVHARCDRVLSGAEGARGVKGVFVDSRGGKRGRFRVKSRAVVLSGGVFGSAIILKRSGLARRSGQVGRNLHAHPGSAISAIFDHPVRPWIGSTQGYGAFIDDRLKIEVLWSPLPLMAVRLPGFGHELKGYLARYENTAIWDAVVRGTSVGRIIGYSGSNPTAWYSLNRQDTDNLVRGLKIVGEMAFAAGARVVMPNIAGLPLEITRPEGLDILAPGAVRPGRITIAATHLFGTCRMGADPRTSVVDSMGEVHDVRNLFVCDASVMPTGTGVNPQEPIMVVADHFAHGIEERLRRS